MAFSTRTAAVWHKEILLALDDGICRLRRLQHGSAARRGTRAFGMIGIGRIFEAYRDGFYTDDDEVALLHRPGDMGIARCPRPW